MGNSCCKNVKVDSTNLFSSLSKPTFFMNLILGEKLNETSNYSLYKALSKENSRIFSIRTISLKTCLKDNCKSFSVILNKLNLIKSLSHPNILKIHQIELDFETHDLYIITEFADNRDLKLFIKNIKVLPFRIIKKFTKELLEALKYSHSRGVVHENLNCKNILLDNGSNIKLYDFGIGALYRTKKTSKCKLAEPPEILVGNQWSAASDVWALGFIFLKMISGFANRKTLKNYRNWPKTNYVGHETEIDDFLKLCFEVTPSKRPSSEALLKASLFECSKYEGSNESVSFAENSYSS